MLLFRLKEHPKPAKDRPGLGVNWDEDVMAKWVYTFGDGKAEGKADMKNLLGGKGANLAEMANLGLPVPPGFTITTEVCTYYYANAQSYPDDLKAQVAARAGACRQADRTRFSAIPKIRCWSRCARARAPRCPA